MCTTVLYNLRLVESADAELQKWRANCKVDFQLQEVSAPNPQVVHGLTVLQNHHHN